MTDFNCRKLSKYSRSAYPRDKRVL